MPTETLLLAVGRYAKGSYLLRVRVSYLVAMRSNKATRVKRKRAQSAMEYLTTYGWAILIIAIILVAFFALGVFNGNAYSPKAQPGSCSITRNQYGGASESGVCTNEIPQFVAQFNGQTSSINMPSPLTGTLSSVTVSFWVSPSSGAPGIELPFTDKWAQQIAWTEGSVVGKAGSVIGGTTNGGNWEYSNTLQPGAWYFVALTGTSAGDILYINGQQAASDSGAVSTGSNAIWIGSTGEANGGPGCCNYAFSGSVSNVQVYNIALPQSEIETLYQEGIGGPPINLQSIVGWWPLNGNANDYSGYGNDGTPANVVYSSNWYSSYTQP